MDLFYRFTEQIDRFLYTETTKKVMRKTSDGLKIRSTANFLIRLYSGGETELEVRGQEFEFEMTNLEEFSILKLGFRDDKEAIEDIMEECGEDTVFYDIGANIGVYTCTVAEANGVEGYAFEPQEKNVAKLEQNADRNDVDVEVLEMAVSDTDGRENISVDRNVPGEGQISITEKGGEEVPSRRVDSLVEEEIIPSPDIVKIDVEGAEIKVLEGMEETINENPPEIIYCELHNTVKRYGGTKEKVRELLKNHGYQLETLEKMAGGREMVKAEKNGLEETADN